jgi:hypothetical protein
METIITTQSKERYKVLDKILYQQTTAYLCKHIDNLNIKIIRVTEIFDYQTFREK